MGESMRLIDADAFLKDILTAGIGKTITEYSESDIGYMIRKRPTVDVAQVKHGRWIEYTKVIIPEPYNKWEQAWKCSECGFDDGFVAYNFCPNCGAKMDGD